jgi:phenylacetate-CoA ligase
MVRERYNKTFRDFLAFLEQSQWWSLEEQKEYQNEQLRSVIRHAYETVPYYHEVFNNRKLTPEDIRTVEDLPKLPVLEKATVRERFTELQSKTWAARRCVHGHTGGTTGMAIQLVYDVNSSPWQWAVWWRHHDRFGLTINDSFIAFAGRSVVPLSSFKMPVWRRNLPMHQTYLSVHHLTKQNMPAVAEYLQKRKVDYYSGYPSALYLVASFFLQKGLRLPHPPRVVCTGAETVLPHQRRVIEQAFDTEVADQYGASEHCGNISECEKHTYHVDMEFGAVEFLPLEGLASNVRRIVCTGFCNPAMPLIRYNIGDIATLSEERCSCGRAAPTVEKIDGRIESYIITPDGRQMGRLDFLFKDSARIEEAQLIQEQIDRLTVKVVRSSGYTSDDERSLLKDMRHYLGEEIEIDVEYVSEIPRTANGKFRQIISKVFKDQYSEHMDRS